jgi:IS5 family transposase
MWRLLLQYAEATQRREWVWQWPMRPYTKRHWVGKKTGPNPTDRAKSGTKRHVLTDGGGVPLTVVITAANVPDMRVVGELLHARVLRAPAGTEQHACLDKRHDYADAERAVRPRRYVPDIRRRAEERRRCRRGERARRWVVERTHSWFNRFRKGWSSGGRRDRRTTSPSSSSPSC